MTDDVKEMGFEEAMAKLDELVKKLETGNLDLDESLEIYSQAVELRERCRQILDESERKVKKLILSSSGTVKEDFSL